MSSEKDSMKQALIQKVIPELRNLKFKGTFPHFRRVLVDKVNILTFQFDKYGGGFIIEIANCDSDGYLTSWGKKIEPKQLTVYDLPIRKRINSSIKSNDSGTDNRFRYDRILMRENVNIYESVSNEVLSKIDICIDYWKSDEINSMDNI